MGLDKKLEALGPVSALELAEAHNTVVSQLEEAKNAAWRIRMPGTAYKVGDKVIVPGVGNFDKVLRCEKAGTTGTGDFPQNYNSISVGNVIPDGTMEWGVVDLVTVPDMEGNPVTSVNGKTGAVNLTASNVGAAPTNHTHEIAGVNGLQAALDGKAEESHVHDYLPLDGGAMKSTLAMARNVDDSAITVTGGTSVGNGATFRLFGKDYTENKGVFLIYATDGTNRFDLVGRPDGTLTWGGKNLLTDTGDLGSADYVVERWMSEDGSSWYRKYKSGWIEQGGTVAKNNQSRTTVTLPIAFTTDKYKVMVQLLRDHGENYNPGVDQKTTTSFRINTANTGAYISDKDWFAMGY